MLEKINESPPPDELARLAPFCDKLEQGCLFHGTGRFSKGYAGRDKSRQTGETIDVLASILEKGIVPQADQIARLFLETPHTVSLARDRLYARCYGEIFGRDDEDLQPVSYVAVPHQPAWDFFMSDSWRALWRTDNLRFLLPFFRNLLQRVPAREWRSALNKKVQLDRWLANYGSITGNYPCIVAVDQHAMTRVKTPYGLNRHEARTAEPITPEQFAAIEVPASRVAETRKLISEKGLIIPVIPMEAAEAGSWLMLQRRREKKRARQALKTSQASEEETGL